MYCREGQLDDEEMKPIYEKSGVKGLYEAGSNDVEILCFLDMEMNLEEDKIVRLMNKEGLNEDRYWTAMNGYGGLSEEATRQQYRAYSLEKLSLDDKKIMTSDNRQVRVDPLSLPKKFETRVFGVYSLPLAQRHHFAHLVPEGADSYLVSKLDDEQDAQCTPPSATYDCAVIFLKILEYVE